PLPSGGGRDRPVTAARCPGRLLQAGDPRQADRAQALHRAARRRHAGNPRLEMGRQGASQLSRHLDRRGQCVARPVVEWRRPLPNRELGKYAMNILLLNAGSSSLKATLMADGSVAAQGMGDWAGAAAPARYQFAGPDGRERSEEVPWKGHARAVERF